MYKELYVFSEDFKEHYLVVGSANKKLEFRSLICNEIDKKQYPNFAVFLSKTKTSKVSGIHVG